MFAYGQTGSGKTFTVSGIEKFVARGLLDGTLNGKRQIRICIFELAGNQASGKKCLSRPPAFLSNHMLDLLNNRKPISIMEDSVKEIQLVGATESEITTVEEIDDLIEKATSLRRTAPTEKNDQSSRSHAICRIRILNPESPSTPDGILYLIDLAGSEAARDIAAHDASRMKETREINTSLSVLKDCIRGRAQLDAGLSKKKPFMPFRQSALTKALKHVFDPESLRACRTSVIACVNPSYLDVGPSKNTLRYAEMLRVAIPKSDGLKPDPEIPRTWTNEMTREWITKNVSCISFLLFLLSLYSRLWPC